MFNFKKKVNERELDLYRRCAMLRFNEGEYQQAIDNCNLALKINPIDSIALEFKIRALLGLENWKDFGEEIGKLEDRLREIEPNNPWIIEYDEFRKSMSMSVENYK